MDDGEIEGNLYGIELRRLELRQEQEARERERDVTASERNESGRQSVVVKIDMSYSSKLLIVVVALHCCHKPPCC